MSRSLLAIAFVWALSLASAVAQSPASVLDKVYTHEQAVRGEAVYSASCAGCHEGQDADGPELGGKNFLDRWREDKLESLYSFIKNTMPGSAPGSLPEGAYVDVVAHILELNGLPPGTRELRADMMGTVQLVGPDGPKPLANLTIVRAVGCLSSEANGTWALVKANPARPVRARIVDGSTPDELKASAAQALGAQSYPLMNVKAPGEALAGHKVQVKGVLSRQGTLDRINVMTLDSVASTCGG
jgi:mono/diheme cytochrome c family protein